MQGVLRGQPVHAVRVARRNGGYADVVAPGEFVKRSALRTSPTGFGLLRLRQFRFSARTLPTLLRPAAASECGILHL